jgi:hypothetical protein
MDTTSVPTAMRTAMGLGVSFIYSAIVPGAQFPSLENVNSLN